MNDKGSDRWYDIINNYNNEIYDIVKVMAEAEREQALEERADEANAGEQEIEDDSFTR